MNHESIGAGDVLVGMANPFETKIEKKILTKEVNKKSLSNFIVIGEFESPNISSKLDLIKSFSFDSIELI